jgi:hypothetical protein
VQPRLPLRERGGVPDQPGLLARGDSGHHLPEPMPRGLRQADSGRELHELLMSDRDCCGGPLSPVQQLSPPLLPLHRHLGGGHSASVGWATGSVQAAVPSEMCGAQVADPPGFLHITVDRCKYRVF